MAKTLNAKKRTPAKWNVIFEPALAPSESSKVCIRNLGCYPESSSGQLGMHVLHVRDSSSKQRFYLRYYFGLLRAAPHKVLRRIRHQRCHAYPAMRVYWQDKCGIEIGGPTRLFCSDHLIPVYDLCRRIDACNFTSDTIWSRLEPERVFGTRLGTSFIAEASDLAGVTDETYDFVLASHVLEHLANPLRALQEWKRIVKDGGTILIIVPHKGGTFDHRRSFTPLEHIQEDFRAARDEGDLTHLEEIVRLHDLALDPPAGTPEQFRERCVRNAEIRGMHHHVFSPETLVSVATLAGLSVLNLTVERPFHIVLFAQRTDALPTSELERRNAVLTRSDADWRLRDPFRRGATYRQSAPRLWWCLSSLSSTAMTQSFLGTLDATE